MRILLVYHFFYPDSVISARIFSDLAESLAASGHSVTVYTSNRLIRSDEVLSSVEDWNHVHICRFGRPNLPQGSNFGRIINSFILQLKWLWSFFLHRKNFDAIIVGTDPQFVWAMFPWIRLIKHNICLIHWAFDLYPEAIIASSAQWMKCAAFLTKPIAKLSYRCCDYIVDIGSEMQKLLQGYHHHAQCLTLTPWALKEPEDIPAIDPEIRKQLFGEAKIGLLYSGTVGHAHDISPFIELARECRKRRINAAFCFAGYGNCYKEQTSVITPEDTNIKLAGFASEEELEKRLAAADINMVSLRTDWNGIVVPSKFFGSLAIGRPVLFSGSDDNSLASYCQNYKIGFVLSQNTIDVLQKIISDEKMLQQIKGKAIAVYQKLFSQKRVCAKWNTLLESIAVENNQQLQENRLAKESIGPQDNDYIKSVPTNKHT